MAFKLNDNQKRFLFDEGYLDQKTLDSLSFKGWQDYFIDNFDWTLGTTPSWGGWYRIIIASKDKDGIEYQCELNLKDDFEKIKRIK